MGKPARTTFRSTEAEAIGYNFCRAIADAYPKGYQGWYDRFAVFARGEWLVLRTLLVSRELYMAKLDTTPDRSGAVLESEIRQRFRDLLPNYFWMVEASAPELFATTRRKFGEILVAADKPATPLNASLLLAARLPGLVLINPGTGTLEVKTSKLLGHTPLFTFPQVPTP
jgi:hypothetical protein